MLDDVLPPKPKKKKVAKAKKSAKASISDIAKQVKKAKDNNLLLRFKKGEDAKYFARHFSKLIDSKRNAR